MNSDNNRETRIRPQKRNAAIQHPWSNPVVIGNNDNVIPFGLRHADVPVWHWTQVSFLSYEPQPWVTELAKQFSGFVGRCIVRYDDFVSLVRSCECGKDAVL